MREETWRSSCPQNRSWKALRAASKEKWKAVPRTWAWTWRWRWTWTQHRPWSTDVRKTISHRLEEEIDHQQEMEGMSPGGHDESGMSPEGVAGHHEMDEGQHH
jgi:hypothetical protein